MNNWITVKNHEKELKHLDYAIYDCNKLDFSNTKYVKSKTDGGPDCYSSMKDYHRIFGIDIVREINGTDIPDIFLLEFSVRARNLKSCRIDSVFHVVLDRKDILEVYNDEGFNFLVYFGDQLNFYSVPLSEENM